MQNIPQQKTLSSSGNWLKACEGSGNYRLVARVKPRGDAARIFPELGRGSSGMEEAIGLYEHVKVSYVLSLRAKGGKERGV